MTKTMRSTVVVGAALGLGALVGGCGLGVLSQSPGQDAAQDMASPPLTVCDPANLPNPGCAQTCADAQAILKYTCADCHDGGSDGNLTRVLDYHGLVNVPASAKYPPGEVLVLPGDPDHSLLYQRIVSKEMPPPSSDVSNALPAPSVSDMSTLFEWIQSCVPNIPGPDAGTRPPPPSYDAGSDGSGPYTLTTCPTAPPAGSCSIQGGVCPYPTETCSCDGTTWSCQSCPAAQPPNGSSCPAVAGSPSTGASFACAYGNVTCNCAGDSAPTWACGVCPATEPSNGQACGNTPISCAYDQHQCDCSAGTWSCLGPSCSVSGYASYIPTACSGFYTCSYPMIDQACTCNGTLNGRRTDLTCSCPAAAPKSGSFCDYTKAPCVYSDQVCSCQYGGWQCTQKCPDVRPADGSACSSSLNCSYDGGLCYCDGTTWHCS